MSSDEWWALVIAISNEHRKLPVELRRMSGVCLGGEFHDERLPERVRNSPDASPTETGTDTP